MPDFSIAGVVLAAGNSQRMGRPKALLTLQGRYFADILLANLQAAGCAPIFSVLGQQAEAIRRQTQAASFISYINPHPEDGMLSSIKIALNKLPPSAQGFIMALVDHPLVKEATYSAIFEAAAAHPEHIVIPSYKAQHGHPVYFGRPYFAELLSTPDTLGARAVVARHRSEVHYLPVDDAGVLQNIDTPQQYRQLIP